MLDLYVYPYRMLVSLLCIFHRSLTYNIIAYMDFVIYIGMCMYIGVNRSRGYPSPNDGLRDT